MKWLAPSAASCDPGRMHREWTGLVNSPSVVHNQAPHRCPPGASSTSLPDCTMEPRLLPQEPRWLPTMSVQCQVADILVRASFKENEEEIRDTVRGCFYLNVGCWVLMNGKASVRQLCWRCRTIQKKKKKKVNMTIFIKRTFLCSFVWYLLLLVPPMSNYTLCHLQKGDALWPFSLLL